MEKQRNVWEQLNYSNDELTELGSKYGISGREMVNVIHELISQNQRDLNQFAGQVASLKNVMSLILDKHFAQPVEELAEA